MKQGENNFENSFNAAQTIPVVGAVYMRHPNNCTNVHGLPPGGLARFALVPTKLSTAFEEMVRTSTTSNCNNNYWSYDVTAAVRNNTSISDKFDFPIDWCYTLRLMLVRPCSESKVTPRKQTPT